MDGGEGDIEATIKLMFMLYFFLTDFKRDASPAFGFSFYQKKINMVTQTIGERTELQYR